MLPQSMARVKKRTSQLMMQVLKPMAMVASHSIQSRGATCAKEKVSGR